MSQYVRIGGAVRLGRLLSGSKSIFLVPKFRKAGGGLLTSNGELVAKGVSQQDWRTRFQ